MARQGLHKGTAYNTGFPARFPAAVIQFRNLRLARGVKTLIEGASLQIHPGWKVGLTGANGSGKSNLYRALRLLAETAQGGVVNALAREGGLESSF